MAQSTSLPALASGEGGLDRYLQEIRQFPMLLPEEEFMLAKRWREHGDTAAAHKLITSHLRLVAKIAMGYRGYGLPIGEVISEGNVGLMQAVKKFEPDKGFRLATYAMWWIRASIQEFVLRSWSLVKMGTTASQKKLFFNLRRLKGQIQALDEGDLRPDQVKKIAKRLKERGISSLKAYSPTTHHSTLGEFPFIGELLAKKHTVPVITDSKPVVLDDIGLLVTNDPALGEGTADETGILDIDGIARGGRAAIDGETVQGRHGCSSISAAVALALPITPGMPAPGCVPAPTK